MPRSPSASTPSQLSPEVKLLQQLVRIPSVNPEGDPGQPYSGEKPLAEFVAKKFEKAGADVELDEVLEDRPNVIATFPIKGQVKRRILFGPHLDTVSITGMTIDPFGAEIKSDGRLYGRGASDTKGPFASMMQACFEFCKTKAYREGSLEVSFAGFVGEETGGPGAKHYAKKCPKFDLVIVGEPTNHQIVHAHKGVISAGITMKGKSGHASMPERGHNAIGDMNLFINWLNQTFIPSFTKETHPLLGQATLNLGVMNGGSKVNIIAEHCHLVCDLRYLPSMKRTEIMKALQRGAKAISSKADVKDYGGFPTLDTDPEISIIQEILKTTRGLTFAPWCCDAAAFQPRKIAAVAMGPGSIKQAHTADEWIKIKDVEDSKARFIRMMHQLNL